MNRELHDKLDESLRLLKGDKEEIKHSICVYCNSDHRNFDCRIECTGCGKFHSRYVPNFDCHRDKI
jgi:hypothetical protein